MEPVRSVASERSARENATGFAGLSSLASKVDASTLFGLSNPPAPDRVAEADTLKPHSRISAGINSNPAPTPGSTETRSNLKSPTAPVPRTTSQPALRKTERAGTATHQVKQQKPPSVLKGTLWLIGVFAVFVMLADLLDNSQSGDTGTPASTPGKTAPRTAMPQSVPSLEFRLPPVGTDHHLNVSEIRWCLREDIRIEAKRPLATTNSEIDRFNAMVEDYNRRCGSYTYYETALDRAKRDVESRRFAIVAGARSEITGSSTSVGEPQKAPSSIHPTSEGFNRRNVTLRGWTSDRNAAQVGPRGSYTEDGIGVNFPLDGNAARLVACTSNYDLHGISSMQLEIQVDGDLVQSGIGAAIAGSANCWNLALSTRALRDIKGGQQMIVEMRDTLTFQVDLTGSAKALNTAWIYVDQRLSR